MARPDLLEYIAMRSTLQLVLAAKRHACSACGTVPKAKLCTVADNLERHAAEALEELQTTLAQPLIFFEKRTCWYCGGVGAVQVAEDEGEPCAECTGGFNLRCQICHHDHDRLDMIHIATCLVCECEHGYGDEIPGTTDEARRLWHETDGVALRAALGEEEQS